jgi:hypothetical protein
MKAAVAGAGHQRDVLEIESAGHFGNHVAAPLHLRLAQALRPIDERAHRFLALLRFFGGVAFHC